MRRPPILIGIAVLLCAGCSGASGDDAAGPGSASVPPTDHGSAVRAAVAATGRSTARIDERIEVRDGDTTYRISVTGRFDLAKDKGRLSVDFPGGAISHLDETFAGDTVYLRGVQGSENTWGSIARDKAEAHSALRAPVNDPEHVLRQVAAMRKASKVGKEEVNGAPAVHYRGMLDHATLTLRMAPKARANAEKMRDLLDSDIPVFADAWVDEKGRLVRARLSLTSMTSVTATMTLSDLGKPVTANAPAPGDVMPLSSTAGVLPG
ncbi:LppX_LprAFG lipoprotein [Streptomyces sp. NPDC002889]|uniref:LppX_LprAFG lipoprotein n=1 Tax=Streptomyces sp. NPDC002889 TaxID=3364669 RepID=UPI00369282EC